MDSIHRSLHIVAPPSIVWGLLAKYDDASWHPWVTGVEVLSDGAYGVGSVRACSFQGGVSQKERVLLWKENEAFSIELFDISGPIGRARSDWTLRPESGGTRVVVNITYEPAPGAPADQVEAALKEHLRVATDGMAAAAHARAAAAKAV